VCESYVEGGRLSERNVGKAIEKIIGKIKRETTGAEGVKESPLTGSGIPAVPEKVYLKALSLHSLEEIDAIKAEVKSGNILIIRVGPLAEKGIDNVKRAVSELSEFIELIGGDIARLGEERIVITPSFVKIWRKPEEVMSGSEGSTEA